MRKSIFPYRVLIVDDNVEAAELIKILLEYDGFEVRTESDGQAGLETAKNFLPHVVFSDLAMPNLTGFELARMLREDHRTSNIILIAISGYSSDNDKQMAYSAGFDMFFVKPFCYDDVTFYLKSKSVYPKS